MGGRYDIFYYLKVSSNIVGVKKNTGELLFSLLAVQDFRIIRVFIT